MSLIAAPLKAPAERTICEENATAFVHHVVEAKAARRLHVGQKPKRHGVTFGRLMISACLGCSLRLCTKNRCDPTPGSSTVM